MNLFTKFKKDMTRLKVKQIASYKERIACSAKYDGLVLTKDSINGYRNSLVFDQQKWALLSVVPFLLVFLFFFSAIEQGNILADMSEFYGVELTLFLVMGLIASPYALFLLLKFDNIDSANIAEQELIEKS